MCKELGHIKRNFPLFEKGKSKKSKERVQTAEDQDASFFAKENALAVGSVKDCWIIDSGAPSHMCNNKELFAELKPLHPLANITVGDGRTIECHGIGMVRLYLELVDNSIVYTLQCTESVCDRTRI